MIYSGSCQWCHCITVASPGVLGTDRADGVARTIYSYALSCDRFLLFLCLDSTNLHIPCLIPLFFNIYYTWNILSNTSQPLVVFCNPFNSFFLKLQRILGLRRTLFHVQHQRAPLGDQKVFFFLFFGVKDTCLVFCINGYIQFNTFLYESTATSHSVEP